ncbi:MAG: phosphoglycerate dehydrogenase, partial [Shinella sp.]|nr:phosphoglycerate dehydrogenase [Shinella sp.]
VGLRFDAEGNPDPSEVRAHIEAKGGTFHDGSYQRETLPAGLHFFYQPDLSAEAEIIAQTADGRYDALIAAATFIPKQAIFPLGAQI